MSIPDSQPRMFQGHEEGHFCSKYEAGENPTAPGRLVTVAEMAEGKTAETDHPSIRRALQQCSLQ
jgi:hypothetical protein